MILFVVILNKFDKFNKKISLIIVHSISFLYNFKLNQLFEMKFNFVTRTDNGGMSFV